AFTAETYTFSSIGNIGVLTISPDQKRKRNIPNAGYLAGYEREFKVVEEILEDDMNFVLFSDGVTDADLSQPFMLYKDVHEIKKQYAQSCNKAKDDNTTLIVMRYRQ